MRTAVIFAASIFVFADSAFSQSDEFDTGVADTLALLISTPPSEGTSVPVTIEAWVYSDDTILSYSAGFKWNNAEMYLDSAKASPLLKSLGFSTFFYDDDHPDSSNVSQKFLLGGFTTNQVLAGDSQKRRKWATYYFTIDRWNNGDTIAIDLLPENEVEFAFVTPGPFYPLTFQPRFEGPLLFPGIATSVEENDMSLPADFALYQNFPNPFNPVTIIEFQIPKRSSVELEIFNAIGQRVATLVNMDLAPGRHQISWNSKTDAGIELPSGVYFYRLRTDDYSRCKKMILIR